MQNWDDAFDNMGHIKGSAAMLGQWAIQAAEFRSQITGLQLDISYGQSERESLDLILPEGNPKGLLVFVHGGYWMRTDKSFWTDRAKGALAHGWATCLPSYTLAPTVRISQMTSQIGAAITAAAERVPGPIRLVGHSAGGHLVTRMICDDTPLRRHVSERIEYTLSISGLHDLRPLLLTEMNKTLGLTNAEAANESSCLHMPLNNPRVTCWVGGSERPEFIRQARLLDLVWRGLDAQINLIIDGNHDHFSVIEGLRQTHSEITRTMVGKLPSQ